MEVVYFMRSKIDMSNHFWNLRGQLLMWRFYFYFVVYSKSNKIIIEYNAHRFSRINSFFKGSQLDSGHDRKIHFNAVF